MWELKFPKANKGWRQFIYHDETIQVTIGNRGSPVIVKRKH